VDEEPGGKALVLPPPSGVTAVDTTGAGDPFSGALATRIAVAAGTSAVRSRGARSGMPTQAEVYAILD
jgi:sugar/nucleoside kinase (ribokinase family)